MSSEKSNAVLLSQARPAYVNDDKFIKHLIRNYNSLLMKVIRRNIPPEEDAEDIAQEVYLRISQKKDGDQIVNYKAFMLRTARNLIIDKVRRGQLIDSAQHEELDAEKHVSMQPSVEVALENRQRLAEFEAVVRELPRKCRDVYILHRVEGMTYPEIARYFNISVSAVEKHMMKAILHIRNQLGGRK